MSEKLQTIIDSSMNISGEMRSAGEVVLEGRFAGVFHAADLVVGRGASISGEIEADSVDCLGNIEGTVRTSHLTLRATCRHTGIAETGALKIEPGAQLDCVLQAGFTESVNEAGAMLPAPPRIDLHKLLGCFTDSRRPCCMDVPWSERQALYATILELLAKGKPLIKIQGEQGSGKTELYHKLRDNLPEIFQVITITDVVGSVSELLRRVAQYLELELSDSAGQSEMLEKIRAKAESLGKQNRRMVWLIDDVQQMYPATLEGVVHILADAFGAGDGLMQIIILGDRTMQETMVATVLEYFEDETNCQLELAPLSIKDTAEYLRFVLQLRGGEDGSACVSLFPYETIRTIHLRSEGNIARINELAGRAVQQCLKAGVQEISPEMI